MDTLRIAGEARLLAQTGQQQIAEALAPGLRRLFVRCFGGAGTVPAGRAG